MILVLSDLWQPFPGGAERLMFNLARDWMQHGLDVQVLTGYEAGQQLDGPPITIAPIGVFGEREQGAALVRGFIHGAPPDVIVAHHLYAREFTPELVASGIPFVHVVLNGERIPEAAFAVFITEWVRAHGNGQPHDLTIMPPAFDDVVASSHGGAIGFIKPIKHKGIELIYALARRLPSRTFLVLRGEWQGLEDIRPMRNVVFMDPVVDMREFYERCRLLLVPSTSEDAGTVAQEATLNGLPCISSNVQGLNETNAGGIRLDPFAIGQWVRAIKLLDNPTRYAATVGSQRAALAAHDHPARLAELRSRLEELWTR